MEDVCWEMRNDKEKELWMPMIMDTSLTLDFLCLHSQEKKYLPCINIVILDVLLLATEPVL